MPIRKSYSRYAAVYIPSKDKQGKDIGSASIEKAIQTVQDRFRSLIGASTAKRSQERERIFTDRTLTGEFDPETGEVAVREEVALVYVVFQRRRSHSYKGRVDKNCRGYVPGA